MRRFTAILILTILTVPAISAKKKKLKGPPRFDYYVLSLSWSPEHCATTSDHSQQCTGPRQFGFVVHGLWPNANSGPNPMSCAGAPFDPAFATPDVLSIMPSMDLVKHEWEKHGTCSGLKPEEYFQRVQDAFALVTIPAEVRSPDHQVTTTPAKLRSQFAEANAAFPAGAFSIKDNGRFLQEVRVCLSKDLKAQGCFDKGDTSSKNIILRPSR